MKVPKKLIGAAGEHYVAYKLSSLGMPVALTRDGSDVIDLMVGDILHGTAIAVQVKTARNARKSKFWEWSVGRKPLALKETQLIYIFIDLQENVINEAEPKVFIVPARDVANQAIDKGLEEHPDWKTFYFQIYDDDSSKYHDTWQQILENLNYCVT